MTSSPGTPTGADLRSVLAADIGSARTKLALFATEDGAQWSVRGAAEAVSTSESPREGIMGGIVSAARELEQGTGISMLARDGSLRLGRGAGQAADAFVACGSAAPPLRLVTLAATAEHSGVWTAAASRWSFTKILASAVRNSGQAKALDVRWADDGRAGGWSDLADTIQMDSPDAVLLTGGFDGAAAEPLVDAARDLVSLRQPGSPPLTLVFAGNKDAVPHLQHELMARAELRVADNVLPRPGAPQPEPAGEALDDLYCQRKLGAVAGYSEVSRLCAAPMLSSPRALALAWTCLAELWQSPVLGLDIGATDTIAGAATPDGSYSLAVDPDLGMCQGWDSARYDIGTANIARWLPIPFSKTEIQSRLASQHTTFSIPQSSDAMLFQEALTREAWRTVLASSSDPVLASVAGASPVSIVASGGVVAHSRSLWRVALMLLDAVEARGVAHLWIDQAGVLGQIGAFSAVNRDAARSLLQSNGLLKLGTVLCLEGTATSGGKAADIEMNLPDGSIRRTIAAWGALHLLHTSGLRDVTVTVTPVRGLHVPGFGDGAPVTVAGNGEVGVILDCRGRPLAPQLTPEHSYARMRSWIAAGED